MTAVHRGGQPTTAKPLVQRTSHDAPDAAVAGCPLGQRHAPAIESADDSHPRTAVAPRFRYGDVAITPVRRRLARGKLVLVAGRLVTR